MELADQPANPSQSVFADGFYYQQGMGKGFLNAKSKTCRNNYPVWTMELFSRPGSLYQGIDDFVIMEAVEVPASLADDRWTWCSQCA